VAKKTIALAEDSLAISQDLFEEGQILSDDVLDNEGRLVQARSNYCQALYEFYMAQSELEYAAGLITMAV
jgi:outer membrane protein TolC